MRPVVPLSLVLCLVFASARLAASATESEARAKAVNQFVEDATNLVVHVDLSRLIAATEGQEKTVPQISTGLKSLRAIHAAGAKDVYAAMCLAETSQGFGLAEPPILMVPLPPGADEKALI